MTQQRATLLKLIATTLDRFGVITTSRFYPTLDLAWPRIVTGFAIMSKQTVDLAMVGIAVGTTGTAGLAFALAYWEVVTMLGVGLAGGTVSLVSQHYGSATTDRTSLVVKQSIMTAILIAIPIMAVFILSADSLIGLLGGDPESVFYGTVYLVFVAPAVLFELLNLIASRTYTGLGDTYTEMVARASGALLNIVLSALLIFGGGFGVAGAAIGTTVSTGFVTVVLAWGMTGRAYGWFGMAPSPVPITPRGPWFDRQLMRQLIEISAPEIGRKIGEGMIVFPLLWIAAWFGPLVVTALEVGRRVRSLINGINWGLGLAASALVGQHLGADNEAEADAYGRAIIRIAIGTYSVIAVLVVVFATPIASVFVTGAAEVSQAAAFVAIGAISSIGLGIDGASAGALVGAGDTRWPFVASLIGRYGVAVPVAVLGLLTPLGVSALYFALLLETYVPGGINYWLFRSGRWKAVSRRYRSSSA